MESQQPGTSVKELRRRPTKLCEDHSSGPSDDILHTHNETENSDDDPEFDRGFSITFERFAGADGQVCELRKTRPLKIRNKKGQGDSAARSTRSSWNWNSQGGKGADSIPNESLATSSQKTPCIRCGSDGHHWRRCHLPFQKNVAFLNINGNYIPRTEKTLVSASEGGLRNATNGDGMPQLENNVQNGELRRSTPEIGRGGENPAEERLTEAQWVTRWNGEGNNHTLMCEEESVYQLRLGESIIIIDSGSTNTVVGT